MKKREIHITILEDGYDSKAFRTNYGGHDWIVTQMSVEAFNKSKQWINNIDEEYLWDVGKKVLLYILIGDDQVYVGQTHFFQNRWNHHAKNHNWVKSFFFLHLTNLKNINNFDIMYLEKTVLSKIKKMGVETTNSNSGQKALLTKKKNFLNELIDDVVLPAIRTLETPLLCKYVDKKNNKIQKKKSKKLLLISDELDKKKVKPEQELMNNTIQNDITPVKWTFKKKDFYGKFSLSKQRISINAGQDADVNLDLKNKWHAGTGRSVEKRLRKWEKDGIIKINKWEGESIAYSFLKDSPWLAPSTAAIILSGKNKNGWKTWKTLTGEKLEK